MAGGREIVVAGAGALGSAIAFILARAGWSVTVADPAAPGANASGVAAGMLAPAFETLFDDPGRDRFEALLAARNLWPAFARAIGIPISRDGAMAVGTHADAEVWTARLEASGAEAKLLSPAEAVARAPGLAGGLWAAFSPDDWRIDAAVALAALRRAAEALGVRFIPGEIVAPPADGRPLVVATGASRTLRPVAPELVSVTPVKGHILRAGGDWPAGPTLRAAGVYLCPAGGELILGASMEPGRSDPAIDPVIVADLRARAEALVPAVGALSWRAETGVRAATTDGLPLAGRSRVPGVWLAVGARRNGWLLAPLIAETVLASLEGRAPPVAGARFDPARV